MLLLIDDIKLRDKDDFLAYMDSLIGDAEIDSLESLSQYLMKTDKQIELMVSDYDEIDDKSFASQAMSVFVDASDARQNIKLTVM